MVNEPKYDGDYATKSYVDRYITGIEDNIGGAVGDLQNEINTVNKTYGAPPNPPYYVGNLYVDGTNLYRCKTERLIGSFNQNDWELATAYPTLQQVDTTYTKPSDFALTGSVVVNGGRITAGSISSAHYVSNVSGMRINLDTDTIDAKNFKLDSDGNVSVTGTVTSSNVNINGGYLNMGSGNFVVDTAGNVTAKTINITGGNMSAVGITGGSLNILNKFIVDSAGNLTATNATLNGKIIATESSLSGTVTAIGGRIGPWYINSSGIYSNATDSNMYADGRLRITPSTGGRLNAGSGGFLINGDGGDTPVVISDYIENTPGGTGTSIGLRAIYGNIRIASNNTVSLVGSSLNFGGSTINSLASYRLSGHSFTGANSAVMYANANCMFSPRAGNYAYINTTDISNRIAVRGGTYPSSRNLKTNIININDLEYSKIYNDLQKLKMYNFDYKYAGIKEDNTDYGFIIDEIEKTDTLSKYAKNYDSVGFLENNTFYKARENDENQKKLKKIKYKEWDRDNYIKTILLMIKALQIKIDKMEEKLNGK